MGIFGRKLSGPAAVLLLLGIVFSAGAGAAATLEVKSGSPLEKKGRQHQDGTIVSIQIEDKNSDFTEWGITYISTGLKVKGLLYEPAEESKPGGRRRAGVVFNHGGVDGIPGPVKDRCRELARLGYVVLAPSYRGEDGSEGEIEVAAGEVDDALNAVRILRGMPGVDATRIAMIGASHGGIITLLAIQRDPSISAAVCAYGVTNTFTWYKYLVDNGFDVSDPLSVKVYGKGPKDKPVAFRKRAPALDAQLIKTPLLLLYGEKDTIVPPSQGRELAAALDKARTPCSLHVIPDVGHGLLFFKDPARRSDLEIKRTAEAWKLVLDFLGRHLAED